MVDPCCCGLWCRIGQRGNDSLSFWGAEFSFVSTETLINVYVWQDFHTMAFDNSNFSRKYRCPLSPCQEKCKHTSRKFFSNQKARDDKEQCSTLTNLGCGPFSFFLRKQYPHNECCLTMLVNNHPMDNLVGYDGYCRHRCNNTVFALAPKRTFWHKIFGLWSWCRWLANEPDESIRRRHGRTRSARMGVRRRNQLPEKRKHSFSFPAT